MNSYKKHSDLIYDVGMHKGEDTDYYLKKGFRVLAFEANPDLINYCQNRFYKEIEDGKLIIVEGAIIDFGSSSENEKISFFRNKEQSVWGTVMENWARRNDSLGTTSEIIDVPVINFSECLRKYGIPYYLKIDIEGMDIVCLKSLLIFNIKPDYISIESEKISFNKLKEELDLLKTLGYNNFKVINQQDIICHKEPLDSSEGKYLNYKFISGSSGLFGNDLPGKWNSLDKTIILYRLIFLGYKLFGDYGLLRKLKYKELIEQKISGLIGTKIPGWYDTHAKHSSISDN